MNFVLCCLQVFHCLTRRHIGITLVGVVIINLNVSKLGMHASSNDWACSA